MRFSLSFSRPFGRVVSSVRLAYNGLRIGDGGAFEKRLPNICTDAQ
jgi:hypothetical protein